MNPNDSDKNVVFEDDAMRHTISASYYDNNTASGSKFNVWLMKNFPFIKDENTANYVLIAFSVIIFIISLIVFMGGNKTQKINKLEKEKQNKLYEESINKTL